MFPQILQCILADIRSVKRDLSACHIIKTRKQVDQRRFTTSGTSDNCSSLSRLCNKINIRKHIFRGSRIPEIYMMKGNHTLTLFHGSRLFRICNRTFCAYNLIYTLCSYTGSRHHDRHHGQHQKCHNDHHCVSNKCRHGTNLHISAINPLCGNPHNQKRNAVHDHHHSRHHKCHNTVGKQLRLCQIAVGLIKPLFFPFFPSKCTNDI